MQQFNFLGTTKTKWQWYWLMLVALMMEYSIYYYQTKHYAFSKKQFEYYKKFISSHNSIQGESIISVDLSLIPKKINDLVAQVPSTMRLEKMVIKPQNIWFYGYVMQHQELNLFWQQLKQSSFVRQIDLIYILHSKNHDRSYPWKFAIKISINVDV